MISPHLSVVQFVACDVLPVVLWPLPGDQDGEGGSGAGVEVRHGTGEGELGLGFDLEMTIGIDLEGCHVVS